MNSTTITKEKIVDFFEILKEKDKKAYNYWKELPYNKWLSFKDIPSDIFEIIFNIIDRDTRVIVSTNGSSFLILKKPKSTGPLI